MSHYEGRVMRPTSIPLICIFAAIGGSIAPVALVIAVCRLLYQFI